LTLQVLTKASNATSASFLVSAIQISWSARLAFDCWLFGSLSKLFPLASQMNERTQYIIDEMNAAADRQQSNSYSAADLGGTSRRCMSAKQTSCIGE
jgi:hypothetical protein